MPYQSIDSGLFYQKTIDKLKQNNNVHFFKNINEVNTKNSFIFNSVSETSNNKSNLWQHFSGLEIETSKDLFDETIFNLMDFDCDQKNSVHFFYTLPYSKKKALIETTWISDLNNASLKDYDTQLKDYIENKLKIKNYKINFQETRSEEHTSELQSRLHLVCRLLLEKKNKQKKKTKNIVSNNY